MCDEVRLDKPAREEVDPNVESNIEIAEHRLSRPRPFVHWSQSQTHITLRIDLIQVSNLDVQTGDNQENISFVATGTGAHGLREYQFDLDLYSTISKVDFNSIERYVLILIQKSESGKWPRLTKHSQRLPWLRIDFDRYDGSDSEADLISDDASDYGNDRDKEISEDYDEQVQKDQLKQIFENIKSGDSEQLRKSENLKQTSDNIFKNKNLNIFNPFNRDISKKATRNSRKSQTLRHTSGQEVGGIMANHRLTRANIYLFVYNLIMFVMFLKVYIVLAIKIRGDKLDDDTFKAAARIVRYLTYAQLLETLHPMLGLVPGGPFMPFLQIIGRLLCNYYLCNDGIRRGSEPFAHMMFVVWSTIEVVRYSNYALRVFRLSLYPLTWLRYTLFLPLYPMGAFCESMVIFAAASEFEKRKNIAQSWPTILRAYNYVLLFPSVVVLMRYMWGQRKKQLNIRD